jgi:ketosteroid isomerase-like protein
MSEENVEICRRLNTAYNSRDVDFVLAHFDPDVEWHDLMHAPDVPERVRGHAAVRSIIETWDEMFDDLTAEVEEYIDAGDCVVCVTHWRAKGKGSGVAVDVRSMDVYEFDDGQIVRVTAGYAEKEEALKAFGLTG